MKFLVTGGSGFIGSHLVKRLLCRNHTVLVIDNFSTGNRRNLIECENNSRLTVVNGDILNYRLLRKHVRNAEYVIHLAAAVGVFNIVKNPIKSLQVNLDGTQNLLKILTDHNVPSIIASTSEIYGKNYKNGLTEDSDRILGNTSILRWTYSMAKSLDESMGYAYIQKYGLNLRFLRFFNTVGENQSPHYGMVLPRFIQSALRQQDLEVFGNGKQKRSFIYVEDTVDAILKVIIRSNLTRSLSINIGNPSEITINDLARKVIKKTASMSKIIYRSHESIYGQNFEDMQRRKPDIKLAKNLLKWEPKYSLDKLIERSIQKYIND